VFQCVVWPAKERVVVSVSARVSVRVAGRVSAASSEEERGHRDCKVGSELEGFSARFLHRLGYPLGRLRRTSPPDIRG
jgi:hypothetical protein